MHNSSSEFFRDYGEMLRDPSAPAHRVVRKSAALVLGLSLALIYYRHGMRGLGLWEPALATAAFVALLVLGVGLIGGILAGSLYAAYLERDGARPPTPGVSSFVTEWLFALSAPLLFVLAALLLGQSGGP